MPATHYGTGKWGVGRFTITVHATQADMDSARRRDPDAVCYHHGGGGGGAAG